MIFKRLLLLAVLASVGLCYFSDNNFLQFNNYSSYWVTYVDEESNTPTANLDVSQYVRTVGHRGMVMNDGSVLEMGIFKNTTFYLGGAKFLGPKLMNQPTWGSYAVLRNTTNKTLPVTWATAAYTATLTSTEAQVTFTTAGADQTSPYNSFYIGGTAGLFSTTAGTFTGANFNISGRVLWFRGLFIAKYVNTSRTALWVLGLNITATNPILSIYTRYDCVAAFTKIVAPANLNTVYAVGTTVGDFNTIGGVSNFMPGICAAYRASSGFLMAVDSSTGAFKWVRRLCTVPIAVSTVPDVFCDSFYFGLAYSNKTKTLFVVGSYRAQLGTNMTSTASTAALVGAFWTPPAQAHHPFLIQFDPVKVAWKTDTFLPINSTGAGEYAYFSDIWLEDDPKLLNPPTVYVAGLFASTVQVPGYGVVKGVYASPVAFVGKLSSTLKSFSSSEVALSYLEHDPRDSYALYVATMDSTDYWVRWYMYRWYMTDVYTDSNFVYQTLASPWSNTPFNSSAPINTRLFTYRKTNPILLMINKSNFTFYLSGQHNGAGKYFPLGLVVSNGTAYMMSNVFNVEYNSVPWGSSLLQSVICPCYHGVLTESDHVCHCENGWNGTDCNTKINCGTGIFVWKENKCHCPSTFYGSDCSFHL